jgi:hypothetical protein
MTNSRRRGVTGPQAAEGFANLNQALAPPEQATETVGVHAVEVKERTTQD